MSKLIKTPNYNLTGYDNAVGIPTFLGDSTENMSIIDSELKRQDDYAKQVNEDMINHVSDLIAEDAKLSDRIDELDEFAHSIDEESIADYKARLDAVEGKVKAQSDILDLLNQRNESQDDQIAKNAENIAALQDNITNITDEIANVAASIPNYDDDVNELRERVGTLEASCAVIEHELEDLTNSVTGFNQDVATLANQMSALTKIVNDLGSDVAKKQDKLTAGEGIRIDDNNVISVITSNDGEDVSFGG